jgi:N-acyl-phosphatidylethanolamine-hydrolysing phospholipase D
MRFHHLSPEDAVKVHLDVKSKKSIAIHWGTFVLADEPLDAPPKRLKEAMEKINAPRDEFTVLRHGETIILPDPHVEERASPVRAVCAPEAISDYRL